MGAVDGYVPIIFESGLKSGILFCPALFPDGGRLKRLRRTVALSPAKLPLSRF